MNTTDYDAGAKGIFVGDSFVGKTCLQNALKNDEYDKFSVPTVNPAASPLKFTDATGKIINLQLWDTSGQEKYRSLSKLFFRNADVAVICYAAGDFTSRDNSREWIDAVREQSENCRLIFAITKHDLIPNKDAQSLLIEADELFSAYNPAGIYMTSSFSGFGIDELRAAIALAAYNQPSNIIPTKLEINENKSSGCC
ncbi:GTP-binding protein YPT10 [Tritrichomonas foetus]|uniref:GTP-binding protein YPT10 n=1 Tax=Tritrichomonas foetus TaxID=1144522 RepID=A0A1J4KAW3_9EUKA|nr:GTP-binding protein YPT10 [Tritrichomonas foetus]|eukprot:OHT06830.1 GTP-binding protein YPT10 [Tritrichomonas foetus]